jgi:hypothetical protein
LSSDRAKGVPTTVKLLAKAKEYLPGFEEPETFVEELDSIVKSVMRYPAYNNSYEKVNELYVGWLGKNGYKVEHTLDTLEALDKKFFDGLEPNSTIDHGVSLKDISDRRTEFMKAAGLNKFATYRPQLLAKKLLSLGIQRKRTSKGNNWLVRFKQEIPLERPAATCHNNLMNRLEMSKSTEELKDESKKKGLKSGDVIDYKGRKVRVELVETKVKNTEHPRDHLYQGRTGYDYNKALMNLMSRMTEEQMEELEAGKLMMNLNETQHWVSQVLVNDVIGVKSERFIVEPKSEGSEWDSLTVTKATSKGRGVFDRVDGTTKDLSWFEIDHARELGLLDILWRDGKPYGIPETRDMTVVLLHDLEEQETPKRKKTK